MRCTAALKTPDSRWVPYDLDSLFTAGGNFFRASNVPALQRMLAHPEIRARYYEQLTDLMDNVLTEERVRPVLEAMLGAVEADRRIDNMIRRPRAARGLCESEDSHQPFRRIERYGIGGRLFPDLVGRVGRASRERQRDHDSRRGSQRAASRMERYRL